MRCYIIGMLQQLIIFFSKTCFLFQILAVQSDKTTEQKFIEELTRITMKISALCDSGYMNVRIKAEALSDALYAQLFSYAIEKDQISNLTNALLINLGLIKVRHIIIILNVTQNNLECNTETLEWIKSTHFF